MSILSSALTAPEVIVQTVKHAISGEDMDMDTLAMQRYGQTKQLQKSATENLSGAGKFLADAGISIGQNLALMPLNALAPGASAVAMGAMSAADKMYELGEQGESAARSLVRGAASGTIEGLTEKIPLDALADLVKAGGKGALKNMLRRSGVEAAEEGVAYTANFIADKLARDPNAKWDWNEFRTSVGSGGVSGLFFGLGGTAVNGVNVSAQSAEPGTGSDNSENVASAAAEGQKNSASTLEAGEYRAEKPQNVEYPTVPIINLSMQDVASLNNGTLPQTGNALRKDAISRARVRLGLDKNSAAYIPASNVRRDGEEYVLKITKASLNKMLSPADGNAVQLESVAVLDNIERIANNGVWFDSQGDRRKRTQINGIDHLKTTVYIDDVPYEVDMRVRLIQENANSAQENVLYYFTPEEVVAIKKVDTTPLTGERRALTGASEEVPTSDPTVPQVVPGVKNEYAQKNAPAFLPGGQVLNDVNSRRPDAMELAKRGDYSGLQKELEDFQKRKKLDELAAEYEKNVGPLSEPVEMPGEALEKPSESDIIKSFQVGRSVGASAKNYPVKLPDSKQHTKFAEGQMVEGKVFAGKGTDTEIRDRFWLESTYKIAASEWQKVSGNTYIIQNGKQRKAEVHWYQAKGKMVEMKVKRYLDED